MRAIGKVCWALIQLVFGRRDDAEYSGDMRARVIAEGGASRREAAEEFEISPQHGDYLGEVLSETGRCAAKPRGGSTSPLEEHAEFLLGLIERTPDLTLDEVVSAMRKSTEFPVAARWRFFSAIRSRSKKSLRAADRSARMWRGTAVDARTGMFDPAHLVFVDETAARWCG